jgi:hypothetical protein
VLLLLSSLCRGLKAALIEREDFASGTSSKSTKLVHGGVRYLEKAGGYSLYRTGQGGVWGAESLCLHVAAIGSCTRGAPAYIQLAVVSFTGRLCSDGSG